MESKRNNAKQVLPERRVIATAFFTMENTTGGHAQETIVRRDDYSNHCFIISNA
jgi:hypothetical protein